MGEEVTVVVVPNSDGNQNGIKTAIDRANSDLPSHRRIARVEFQNEDLPKTSTLKVQRSKLRDRYSKSGAEVSIRPSTAEGAVLMGSIDAAGEAGNLFVDVARVVAEVAEGRVQASEVTPEMKLQIDLGIDSIGRVDLLHKLELRLNIAIPSETEGKLFTVRDVISVAEAARKEGSTGKAGRAMWKRTGKGVEDVQAGMRKSMSKSLLQGVFGTTASVFMNTYLRVECFGLEHVPQSGPYILAANHCSHLDSVAIREVLGNRAAGLHVMGAKDYFFDTRLKSWFFTTFLNALPLDREENAAESLAACRAVLEGDRAILLFPEGTRSISGELQPFKPGIGVLGLELEVPIIPIYLRGTYESLPKGRSVPRPTRIEVRIGPAVDFSALKAQRGNGAQTELYRKAAGELRARIEALANLPGNGR
jgi:long-chain acyl-CoA synthetase